ncbi:hypothetical protein IMSAG192_01168 [Muribaculaceae bacterium]|nr:hypothetical protein IMSAG192_01168 [Muribaculaceae bacterium]
MGFHNDRRTGGKMPAKTALTVTFIIKQALIFRVQNDIQRLLSSRPARLAIEFLARPSSLTAVNIRSTKTSSNVEAICMVMGNTVAVPLRPTPWRASLHQCHSGIPSRGIAGDESLINDAFSSRVRRESRSSARSSNESDGF